MNNFPKVASLISSGIQESEMRHLFEPVVACAIQKLFVFFKFIYLSSIISKCKPMAIV